MALRRLCWLLFAFIGGPAWGADPAGYFENSYAVVIGIRTYQDSGRWPELVNAENDAREMARLLGDQGFAVQPFYGLQATKDDIVAYLEDELALRLTPKDRLVFYFSGHGETKPLGGRDRGYIIPYDGTGRSSTWITMEKLQELADKLGNARHQLFIFDACFGGLFATKSSLSSIPEEIPNYVAEVTRQRARQYLTAGGAKERTPARSGLPGYQDYSHFTAYLVKGLRAGAADSYPDGVITASELDAYLGPAAKSRYNTPRGDNFAGHEQGNFVFRSPKSPKAVATREVEPVFKGQPEVDPVERELVAKTNARIRGGPSVQTSQVGSLRKGQTVWVAGKVRGANWYLVEHANGRGYVYGNLLEESPATVPSRPPAVPVATKARRTGTVFRDTLRDGSQGPEMVVIPAGSFQMGSSTSEKGHHKDEGPKHRVSIAKRFAMGKYEVTFEEYDRFADATGGQRPEDRGWGRGTRPVIKVSWENARQYAKWLSEQTGKRYRLPTEAEWEYAARAGTETAYWWGNEIGKNKANCDGCGSQWDNKQTAPVGSFEANRWGPYDTAGNVWEWVQDCWHDSYKGAPEDGSAWEFGDCAQRVIRGGSWYVSPWYVRSANRYGSTPVNRNDNVGFRLAQDL